MYKSSWTEFHTEFHSFKVFIPMTAPKVGQPQHLTQMQSCDMHSLVSSPANFPSNACHLHPSSNVQSGLHVLATASSRLPQQATPAQSSEVHRVLFVGQPHIKTELEQ